MKKLLILFLLILKATFASANDTGYGCMTGEHWVYTQYMGMASVTGAGPEQYRYYSYSGFKIPIYRGWGHNLYRGYRCGWINVYSATSFYDSTIPPYGENVNIEGEQEYTLQGAGCIISTSLGGQPLSTDGQSGEGRYVYYDYNKTDKCGGGTQTPVPLDDYIWVIMMGTVLTGAIFLRNKLAYI
jgi:hypothetical protein